MLIYNLVTQVLRTNGHMNEPAQKPPAVMNRKCPRLARAPRALEPLRQILKFVRVHTRSMNARPTKGMAHSMHASHTRPLVLYRDGYKSHIIGDPPIRLAGSRSASKFEIRVGLPRPSSAISWLTRVEAVEKYQDFSWRV